jgi:hypothetical protein
MSVPLDDLRGHRRRREAEGAAHIRLDRRRQVAEGADRAGQLADADRLARALDAGHIAR